MKTPKIRYKKIAQKIVLGSLLGATLSLSSCMKNFEEFNTSNIAVTEEDLLVNNENLRLYFANAQRAILNFSDGSANSYQLQQNFIGDVYGGYMMSSNPFNSGQNNFNYALVPSFNSEPFKVLYLDVLGPLNSLRQANLPETYPALWGAALTVKVLATSRVTDIYGPIPYSMLGQTNSTSIPYDSQEAVYTQLFAELDEAQGLLESYVNGSNVTVMPETLDQIDLIYSGNGNNARFSKWLRLLHSLRLRLAMRLVKVNPTLAQQQAAKSLSSNMLIEANTDNATVRVEEASGFYNVLEYIANDWTDMNIGASLESYLVGYQDPRVAKYLDLPADTSIAGYKGIRIGAIGVNKAVYSRYSTINFKDGTAPSFNSATAPILMTAAEVYFLRAEAALRGWANATGTPQSLYEEGVRRSFDQWGADGVDAYLQNNSNMPIAYVDPRNSANNAAQPSTITIQWNEGGTQEEKLERIITQKWIALFPEGQEAWSEFRRTGYPKLFPVAQNNSGGLIDTDIQIRRIPFSQNEYNANNAEVQKAVALLGGPDNGGTRLWWDTAAANF